MSTNGSINNIKHRMWKFFVDSGRVVFY